MGLLGNGFDPFMDIQDAADVAGKGLGKMTGAQGAASAVSSKAAEVADVAKQGVEKAKEKDPDELELAVIEYNQTYTDLESEGIPLYPASPVVFATR